MDSSRLYRLVTAHFRLPLLGVHGVTHWARVFDIGSRLAKRTGASLPVVEAFALLHDVGRESEGICPRHGARGADLARVLQHEVLLLDDVDLHKLVAACEGHTDGALSDDPTIGTCWDADRLDLGRVGVVPSPGRLCTPAARDPEMISWALLRSRDGREQVPEWIRARWSIPRIPTAATRRLRRPPTQPGPTPRPVDASRQR